MTTRQPARELVVFAPVSLSQKRAERLPSSAYAEELQRSAGQMRFPPELEARYRAFYLAERRTHVRSFHLILALLTTAVWIGGFLLASEPQHVFSHWRVAGIAILFFGLAWLAYSAWFERLYLGLAPYGCILISIAGAFEVAHQMAVGRAELFAVLTTWSLGLYYLCGILFSSAVFANGILLASFSAAIALSGEPAPHAAYLTAFLAGVAAIGGLAFRNQGARFRRSFLTGCFVAELAARDGLTGLKNRRAFDEHLVRTWQQALRDRRRLVLFMIDVDHFKRFNDRYGHQLGDTALQRIAAVVNGFAGRPLDLAARYGGEEFAIIFYDMQPEHAADLATRLRLAVQELSIEHAESDAGVATISIGVAIVRPTLARSPEGAVQLADEALYESKAGGRNRATVFDKEYDGLATGTFRAATLSR
jgi:diguanylate cyclase (GGDEF)-like protein